MSGENPAGQAAPVEINESANLEAAQVNAAATQTQTDGGEGGDQESGAEKKFSQKELDEILQKRVAKAEARAERRVLRTLERLQGQQAPAQQASQQQEAADGKPAPREGETIAEYADRLTDWKLDQREQKAKATQQEQQARTLAEKTESIYAKAQALPGFDREAFDDLPLTRPLVEALIDSDNAPALMKHMADNPEEVERIAKLSPARQAAEIGRLEAQLGAPATRQTTNAPAPIRPLKGGSSGAPSYDTTDPRSVKTMSTSEWIAAENARMAKRYGARS